jgi:hypothetical protein
VGVKVTEDTKAHDEQHQTNIDEIKKLKEQIQSLKDEQTKKEQDHLSNVDKLNQENHGKIKEKDSKIGETDLKGNKELTKAKKKLEDQMKEMV